MLALVVLCFFAGNVISTPIELTDGNFKDETKDQDVTLVMFYAPWCGHCQALKPTFEDAAKELQTKDPPVHLGRVDCTGEGKGLCETYQVRGYPTLKLFKKGIETGEYTGPRDRAGIVQYMMNQVKYAVRKIKNDEGYEKCLGTMNGCVLGFFDETMEQAREQFITAANLLHTKYSFGIIESEEVAVRHEVDKGITLFRPKHLKNIFEPSVVQYPGALGEDSHLVDNIKPWLRENILGLVAPRTMQNKGDFSYPLVVAYFTVDYKNNAKGTSYWRNRILKVADNWKNEFNFAISDRRSFYNELKLFGQGGSETKKPVICAWGADHKKYTMEEEFSTEALEEFLVKLKNNQLSPHMKSEPLPEENDDIVKKAVAKNFDEIVSNNKKDVLLTFYAPWCTHCKEFLKTLDDLAEKMKEEDVEFVKMDATKNDIPHPYEVKGYPTIYWVGKHSKSTPIHHMSGRELNEMIKFVSGAATHELIKYTRSGELRELAVYAKEEETTVVEVSNKIEETTKEPDKEPIGPELPPKEEL